MKVGMWAVSRPFQGRTAGSLIAAGRNEPFGRSEASLDCRSEAPRSGNNANWAAMSVIEWRIGLRPLAADLMPLLGEVPGVPGLFVATGLGGTGLALGPPTGRLLAKSMMGR